MRKFVCMVSCIMVLFAARSDAGVINLTDSLGLTAADSNYNVPHDLGVTISADPAVYLVATMQFHGTLDANGWNTLGFGNPSVVNEVQFGRINNTSRWGMNNNGKALTSITVPTDTPVLLVLRFNQNTGQMRFYVDPDLTADEPLTADATRTNPIGDITKGAYQGGSNTNVVDYTGVAVYYGGESPFGAIRNITPGNGQQNVDLDQVLEWVGPNDPNFSSIVSYTIYLDPNETFVTDMNPAQMDYFDDTIPGTQTTYDPSGDLAYDTSYFWRVVATVQYDDNMVGDTNDITSPVWAFSTKKLDTPPVVDAGEDIMIAPDMATTPFALEGTIIDDGTSTMTVVWEAFDVSLGGGLTTKVVFADPTDPNTTVTVSQAGSYIVKLTATDAVGSVSDQKQITVVGDGCRAAKMLDGYQANYYDRNGDCVVNLEDFVEFALQWFDSTAVSDAVFYNGFLPQDAPITDNGLVSEIYLDIAGGDVNDLLASALYPDSPDFAYFITEEFRAPSDIADDYGQRIRGYIVPSVSGDYTFYIASDDQSRLFLSTDADPANAVLMAEVPDPDGAGPQSGWTQADEWDKYPQQTSAAITMTAGEYYYVEVLHKERGSGDRLSVGWSADGGTTIEVIPATELRYVAP